MLRERVIGARENKSGSRTDFVEEISTVAAISSS